MVCLSRLCLVLLCTLAPPVTLAAGVMKEAVIVGDLLQTMKAAGSLASLLRWRTYPESRWWPCHTACTGNLLTHLCDCRRPW